jgi:hypothetical protein
MWHLLQIILVQESKTSVPILQQSMQGLDQTCVDQVNGFIVLLERDLAAKSVEKVTLL